MDKNTFTLLYKAKVRPHLEYGNAVWQPYKKGDVEIIEKVQKRATKLIISLKHLPYSERLKQLQLPTLKYRHLCGDMIEVFKMEHYDVCAVVKVNFNTLSTTSTLQKSASHYKLRKNFVHGLLIY